MNLENGLDWIQTISIMATVIASAYYIHREVQMDIRAANARTDKLYEMFCKIQEQMKDELLALKKEQYELIKEGKK
jgi:hypothetical protein